MTIEINAGCYPRSNRKNLALAAALGTLRIGCAVPVGEMGRREKGAFGRGDIFPTEVAQPLRYRAYRRSARIGSGQKPMINTRTVRAVTVILLIVGRTTGLSSSEVDHHIARMTLK